MIFRSSASTTRPQTTAGVLPETALGYQMTETAGAVARVKLYAKAAMKPASAPTLAENVAAGSITIGNHSVKVTYVTAEGETEPSAASNVVAAAGGRKLNVTAIPVAKSYEGAEFVTGRKVYLNEAGGVTWYLAATINDNTTTTATLDIDDVALALLAAAPSANTSGVLVADQRLAASETVNVEFPMPVALDFPRAEITTGAAQTLIYGR